jgi:hypothetical protein
MEKCWLKGEMFYQEAMLVEYIQGVFYSNSQVNLGLRSNNQILGHFFRIE